MRLPRTLIAIVLALGVLLVSAAPASAGRYTVYVCKTPDGRVAPTDGWQVEQTSAVGEATNRCATGGSLRAALSANVHQGNGARIGWGVSAPENTSIASAEFWRWVQNAWSSNADSSPTAYVSWPSAGYHDRRWWCETLHDCVAVGTPSEAVVAGNYWDSKASGISALHFATMCSGPPGCTPGFGWLSVHEVQAVRLRLDDPNAPQVTNIAGPLLAEGAHAGTEKLTFAGTDLGAGLYRTFVDIRPVDGVFTTPVTQIVDPNGGKCAELEFDAASAHEFGHLAPCRLTAQEEVELDTTAYPDGDYVLRVRVEDAAGNVSVVVADRPFEIDNVPAPQVEPGTLVVTGSARLGDRLTAVRGTWSGTGNTYAYAWLRCTDDAEASCAPIDGATDTQLQLEEADLGRFIRVQVTATNADGSTPAASPAVGPVTLASGEVPECADGVDNDIDGEVDEEDVDCTGRADTSEAPPPTPTPTSTPGGSGGTAVPASGPSPTPTPVAPSVPNGANASAGARLRVRGSARRMLRFGQRSRAALELLDADGRPISGARLVVQERLNVPGAEWLATPALLTTDSDGRARLAVRPGPSRAIRVGYRSRSTTAGFDALAEVEVTVRSKTSLRKSRSFLRNGQTLRFSGRILSRPVPRGGVGIDLQALAGGDWQTFQTVTTTGDGRWHARYTFTSTTGLQTYRFRALVRADSGFPYTPSISKRITVRVRG